MRWCLRSPQFNFPFLITVATSEFPLCLRVNGTAQDCCVKEATTFLRRLRGLLFSPPLAPDQALWIRPCNSIHMIGVRYAIDVAFLDSNGMVLQVNRSVAPGRMAACWAASSVVEMTSGACEVYGIQPGVKLSVDS